MKQYDSIIIGGGVNGLVAANYLAKAGQKVLVVEKQPVLGGTNSVNEIFPGFQVNTCAMPSTWINPEIVSDLQLNEFGMETFIPDVQIISLNPKGKHLILESNFSQSKNLDQILSENDRENLKKFVSVLSQMTSSLRGIYNITPTPIPRIGVSDLFPLIKALKPLTKRGRKFLVEMLRVLPMSVSDWLDEWFESDILKGTLASFGVQNLCQGPMSAGTSLLLLHHCIGITGKLFNPIHHIKSGAGSLIKALEKSGQANGVSYRTGSAVGEIVVKDGIGTGIKLTDGEEFHSRKVISGADPGKTFLELVNPLHLETKFIKQIRNIKYRGATSVIHLSLSALPTLNGASIRPHGLMVYSPNIKYLEKAYDHTKYGTISDNTLLRISIPTLTDQTLAPEKKHVMSIQVQFTPYHLRNDKWSVNKKDELLKKVLSILEGFFPDLTDSVEQNKVYSPKCLEEMFNLTEGNMYHGELMLDQFLFMRPVPSCAQYRTPIKNLFLCGSGTHPGGGLPGMSGRNAANEILKG